MSRIIDGAAPEVQAEFESLWRALDGNLEELTRRLDALEQDVKYAACAGAVEARLRDIERRLPKPICVRCSGPVEPERHCYAHPTCNRCLPPPEPLPVRLPRSALTGSITDHGVTVRPAAPTPDYGSDLPAEVEACSCDEAVSLRARIAVLERELRASQRAHGLKCDEVFALRALLGRIGVYADTFGKDLVPTGPDSYGEGVRAVKSTLKNMLAKVRS